MMGQSFAWTVLVLFLIGTGFGVREVVYADSVIQLQSIQVIPSDGLSISKLESLQKKYLGKNTAQIDLSKIARELELDHQILTAQVRRDLPNKLEILVERRVPFAYVRFGRNGRWTIVSRDAVILDVVTAPGEGLYKVENDQLGNQTPKIGMRISRNFIDLARLTDQFRAHPVGQKEQISSMAILPNNSAAFYLGDLMLKFNLDDTHFGETLDKFEYLLETENRTMIEYVDLRFNRVILKRKMETQEKTSNVPKRKKNRS